MPYNEKSKQYRYQYEKEKLKRIPLDMPKDTYEWVKVSADYVGETVNGFIKRATYERAALECAPSYEEAVLKLEEKNKQQQEKLDKMEKSTEIIGGKEVTVYTSGKSPAGGQSGRLKTGPSIIETIKDKLS